LLNHRAPEKAAAAPAQREVYPGDAQVIVFDAIPRIHEPVDLERWIAADEPAGMAGSPFVGWVMRPA
jgi:hypothetical protein